MQHQQNFQPSTLSHTQTGQRTAYQPIGYVPSVYGQNQNQQQNQLSSNAASSQVYHTMNYHGNQAGHDQYLRSDSSQPNIAPIGQQQLSYSSNLPFGQQSFQSQTPFRAQNQVYQQQVEQQSYGQQIHPQTFHTANYRGNQTGHDQYLRSDSTQPSHIQSNQQFFAQQGARQFQPQQQIQFSGQNQIGKQQLVGQQFSPQSYHTANYRGNQAGHDQYLRSDSVQPNQSSQTNQQFTTTH